MKRWNMRRCEMQAAEQVARSLSLPPLAVRVLMSRGYDTPEKISQFLNGADALTDPYALRDMDRAVERIRRALCDGERIAVYGDYDCDGIMSTVLLYRYFESEGADICYYIPERDREGYGLNIPALDRIHAAGVSLVVTVDNGVTAIEEIAHARAIGMDVVVTDHHKPRETLPDAVAVVDPHREDDTSGCRYLAGAGVAFKLICALEQTSGEDLLDQYGDLTAIATIADIVPLHGENRRIVRHGLEMLQTTENDGLAALVEVCGLSGKRLASENVAFGLVPRINSAGRFDRVDDAIELLIGTGDRAAELAKEINALNEKRRSIEEKIVQQILEQTAQQPDLVSRRVLVISGENWHHGIVGIVASRMVERFGKPCVVLSIEEGAARGSARSVEGFSIIDAISACAHDLTRFGGHNQAAGVTLPANRIGAFMEGLEAYAAAHHQVMPQPTLTVDCAVHPNELNPETVGALSLLEPFGSGHETPVFLLESCLLQGIYPIGDGKHVRLKLQMGGTSFYAVYFGMTQANFPYTAGERLDLAATLDAGEWNGEMRVSVKIRDLRISQVDYECMYRSEQVYQCLMRNEPLESGLCAEIAPSREDIAVVYRYLRAQGAVQCSSEVLYARLHKNVSSLCKMKIVVDVLDEMNLVERAGTQNIRVIPKPSKVDIGDSKILQRLQTAARNPA